MEPDWNTSQCEILVVSGAVYQVAIDFRKENAYWTVMQATVNSMESSHVKQTSEFRLVPKLTSAKEIILLTC